MTKSFRLTLVWLAATFVTVLMALNSIPGSLVDGHYIPVGNDSFYHARRILDTVQDPSAFYEFDNKIHAPEGSLLTWPWAYDYFMAAIVRTLVSTGAVKDPMTALAYVPVAASAISIALIVGIAAVLELSTMATLLAALCVALSALTQSLHGVGIVDHHFAEYMFALAALLCGLSWMQHPDSRAKAAVAGAVLGIAPAFQNGLFILQLPLLVTIALLWLRQNRILRTSALAFGAALLLATILVLLPSVPFREGKFEFYFLSWFHLYVAACTATAVILTSMLERSKRSVIGLSAFAVVVSLPLIRQGLMGSSFLTGQLEVLPLVVEAQSVLTMIRSQGFSVVFEYYSLLILLVPASLVGCVWYLLKTRTVDPRMTLFCVACAGGLLLLTLQYRLHVFGSFALFLPVILVADRYADAHPNRRLPTIGLMMALLAASYVPPVRGQLFAKKTPGNDTYYGLTRGIYPALADVCRRNPGLVLAGSDNGHYVRFHSDCPVIGNNFLLTPQHVKKFREIHRLMAMTPDELLVANVPVRYVFVSLGDVASEHPGTSADIVIDTPEKLRNVRPALVGSLLFGAPDGLNPRYHLIAEMRFKDSIPFARLYEIRPASESSTATE